MRTLPRMILALLFALSGCAGDREANQAEADTTQVLTVGPPGQAAPPAAITLSLSSAGEIVVQPDSLNVGPGAQVRWESQPADAAWVVAFPTTTPFQGPGGGQRIFHGGTQGQARNHGPIRQSEPPGAHKYWVFFPDASGKYTMKDPTLVIEDDMRDTVKTNP